MAGVEAWLLRSRLELPGLRIRNLPDGSSAFEVVRPGAVHPLGVGIEVLVELAVEGAWVLAHPVVRHLLGRLSNLEEI
jgi:hypothetical protein